MANAWMIRYDGKEIPVTVHIYGSTEDVEETLYASEWLYNNTTDSSVKEQIRSLVATYAHELDPDAKPAELEDTMLYQIKHLPYKTVTPEFVKQLDLEHAKINANINAVNTAVNDALNQEFLRARYGGMYDTDSDGGEIYFRISSINYNWFPVIWEFVYKNKNRFKNVTVVKDPEATGMKNMYLSHNGKKIDHMPTDEFINLSGRPVMDSYGSVSEWFSDMNMLRRHGKIMRLHAKDRNFVEGPEFSREK